jgi:DNA-binding beta-propeller fold protein YncE
MARKSKLVDTSRGDGRPGEDARKWCVGIAVDTEDRKVYWTQKGGDNAGEGRICRANINTPPGQTAADRKDIELLYQDLPEPIDLELDTHNRMIYWTDRGDPPRGNTVNRAPMDASENIREAPEILAFGSSSMMAVSVGAGHSTGVGEVSPVHPLTTNPLFGGKTSPANLERLKASPVRPDDALHPPNAVREGNDAGGSESFRSGGNMTDSRSSGGRLFVLDLCGGRVFSLGPDGSNPKTLVTGCRLPDGLAVDAAAGYIYWTNMGIPHRNDGSIERADLDGGNRRFIIPEGDTFTPKQLYLEKRSGKLYWSDREGMRVMRANLDGSQVETLIQTGEDEGDRHDPSNWCVGITVDPLDRQIYWTQKDADDSGHGRIFRADIVGFRAPTRANRIDVDTLFERLPEPVDLELDLEHRALYWTDRGHPPRGNTVRRTPLDGCLNQEIVLDHLREGIGLALDVRGDRMFLTDLSGSIYSAHLDGSEKRPIAMAQGNLAGIAYADNL